MKMYILTREINEYDQDGDYFVDVFPYKPTVEEIAEAIKEKTVCMDARGILELCIHIQHGGGRRDTENEWFLLKEKTIPEL